MPGCLLPALMAAGMPSPAEIGLLAPGPRLTVRPPSPTKGTYGTPLSHHLDTENFSIQWETPAMDLAIAEQVGEDMEEAWDALVEVHGWTAPVSSDEYLITVILDPDLEGTGLTHTLEDELYPLGVPVIYIHPEWATPEEFMASLSAHELAHALQFAVRDWYSGGDTESWYWEASAEWQAELAQPEADTYAWSAQHYATAPHADHHSMAGYHQYGMFLLNAYLDEYVLGSDGFRDLWLDNAGLVWSEEIAGAVGEEPAHVWAAFSAAYGSRALRESDLYLEPLTVDGTTSLDGWLGTHYIPLGAVDDTVLLDGGVGVLVRDGDWVIFEDQAEIPEGTGDAWLMVVNPNPEPLHYRFAIGEWDDADTAEPTEAPGPEEGRGLELAALEPAGGESDKGCGCATGSGGGASWIFLPLVAWRRRAATR